MEPITISLETAKEVADTAKRIRQVYNVSQKMKTVSESEGADQVGAATDLAQTFKNMPKSLKETDKGSSNEISSADNKNGETSKTNFIDILDESKKDLPDNPNEDVGFVDALPQEEGINNVELLSDVVPDDVCQENLEKLGLTDEEKNEIKEKTGWSDKIVDAIRTKEEAQIYMDAGLVEGEVNGKPALLQPRIDGSACNDSKWPNITNKELAEEGFPPRDAKGRPYELHHIGQNPDSPLAELTYDQHHSNGNFKILHTFDDSSIDRLEFNKERRTYWKERSKSL